MKTVFNCACPTLFRGNEVQPKTEVKAPVQPQLAQAEVKTQTQPQLQPQLKADTVEISAKTPKAKCEGDACKK